MNKDSKIYVTGHRGMVGTAVERLLYKESYRNVVTSRGMDLRDHREVNEFFRTSEPEYVFLFAAKVGGIKANIESPVEFLYNNLMIEANVIRASHECDVRKLLFLGSSCMYPRLCEQPMKEEDLLSGRLEPTNEGYALAKIVGLKLCEYYCRQYGDDFFTLVPPNLYGPNDNFDPKTSHVIAGMIRKFVEAKRDGIPLIKMWGTGRAQREFLYVEDLAEACIYFMNNRISRLSSFTNVGYGTDVTIKELAEIISKEVGYDGDVAWDPWVPDGMPRKLLKLNIYGWRPKTSLVEGIKKTVKWYEENIH